MFTSQEQARFCACWVREMIEFLGLSCHPTKCQWEPSQSVYHLGITVNTAAGVFEVPKQKLAKLWWLAIGLRITAKKNQRLVQAKFCSFAQSIKLALTPALLFLRNCYDDVKQPVWQCGCSRLVGALLSTRSVSVALQLRGRVPPRSFEAFGFGSFGVRACLAALALLRVSAMRRLVVQYFNR
ncbi:hypothetical protein VOLCADRAFT_91732 [Volvox carteri f. nagariensis]|nr:uncharacterized protein VOLCADRAFT_91732 [Volvox carteri f. nagariensis]EFJ47783.1 hypothetical protein VOLCADRAFT_91732 [Volvox carteri f. nagariensis]|eukprot:XP_002951254.1 hypothetical protein VOLCADRAFT_91732 [Volvox carteri f. nagariensis]